MGKASSSSEAQSAIDASGSGVVNWNQPNKIGWIVAGAVLLFAFYIYMNKKGRG